MKVLLKKKYKITTVNYCLWYKNNTNKTDYYNFKTTNYRLLINNYSWKVKK